MNEKHLQVHPRRRAVTGALIALTLVAAASGAHAASYIYKGELLDRGEPAEGDYDLRIRAFADAEGRQPVGSAFEAYRVPVSEGRFATGFDLPESSAQTLWIDVALRRHGDGDGEFKHLGGLEPVSVTGGACPASWQLAGNAGVPSGSLVGTTDGAPLRLGSSGFGLGLLAYNPIGAAGNEHYQQAASVVFGSPLNNINTTRIGSTVIGGGAMMITGPQGPVTFQQYSLNAATGHFATSVGGAGNRAEADFSFAAGYAARARHRGSFVWACADCGQVRPSGPTNPGTYAESSRDNEFSVAAMGGLRFFSGTGGRGMLLEPSGTARIASGSSTGLEVNANGTTRILASASGAFEFRADSSVYYNRPVGDFSLGADGYARITTANSSAGQLGFQGLEMRPNGFTRIGTSPGGLTGPYVNGGSGSWVATSDRNLKTNFEPVDTGDVLDRVLSLPITRWNYKTTDASERHLGVMAQDFHAAFGLNGDDDTGIAGIDADGVALAAIQGLATRLQVENAGLREQMAAQQDMLDLLHARLMAIESVKRN